FVSRSALDADIAGRLGLAKTMAAVGNVRQLRKADMIHNDYQPVITVDPETYQVRADGQLLWCEPAASLPMAQRYFLF
ncbi:MAG: urease subunit alpha, partial [Betaproteobacteria bacterium]